VIRNGHEGSSAFQAFQLHVYIQLDELLFSGKLNGEQRIESQRTMRDEQHLIEIEKPPPSCTSSGNLGDIPLPETQGVMVRSLFTTQWNVSDAF
jgi:hypothetical protein